MTHKGWHVIKPQHNQINSFIPAYQQKKMQTV